MPLRHVIGVDSRVGTGLVERIVKLQAEVMRLQIDDGDHRRRGAGEFAEAIENILRLERHTFPELLAVDQRGGPDFPRFFPWARRVRMERTARTEFTFAQRFDCREHIRKMRRTIALHQVCKSRRILIRLSILIVLGEKNRLALHR
jgi:hypothetical protein